jgi:predicted transposase YdaD
MLTIEDDLRKTRFWQEGVEEGELLERSKTVRICLERGMSVKAIAKLLKLRVQEVRRLSKCKD